MVDHIGLLALAGFVLLLALGVGLMAWVIRREMRRREDMTRLAARLGLSYQRGVDPWQIAGEGAEVDESMTGWFYGVPVAVVTRAQWVGDPSSAGDGPRSRKTWTIAAIPISEPVDLDGLRPSPDLPVRRSHQPGWLIIAKRREIPIQIRHAAAGVDDAERLVLVAIQLAGQVAVRQPVG